MKGKFIVIEGTDSSGKRTQSRMLKEYLEKVGLKVKLIDFPQYNTPFGKHVAEYLRGEYGSLEELPAEIPSMLYAIDRYQFKNQIRSDLENGIYYVSDRYTQSNLGFQPAKLHGRERLELIEWIEQVENRLPQPDIVIFLYVPIEVSQELIGHRALKDYLKGDIRDIHEENITYQKNVIETYLDIVNNRDNWFIIHCVRDGQIRSKKEIHQELIEVLAAQVGLQHNLD